MPSRFLRELPMEYVQIEGTPPFGSGFGSGSNISRESNLDDGFSNRGNSFQSYSRTGTKIGTRTGAGTGSGRNPGFGKHIQLDSPKHTSSHNRRGKDAQTKVPSSAAYTAGDRVFHDQYGSGHITESRMENGREMVTVWFDTGRSAKFIPKYARLEKIAQD